MTGSLLGNAVRRVEDPNLLTGRGRYVDDLPIEGALHAHFVRSPIAHGRVVSIDASEALTMPLPRLLVTPPVTKMYLVEPVIACEWALN